MTSRRPFGPAGPFGGGVTVPGQPLPVSAADIVGQLREGLFRRYQLHTPADRIIGLSRLNVDALGTGLLGFQASPVVPENAAWDRQNTGLTLGLDRPASATDGTLMGYFATVDVESTTFFHERRFLLLGTFRRPVRQPLAGFVPGDWAAAMLVHFAGADFPGGGVSCQFKTVADANGQPTDRTRLNCPSTGSVIRLPFLEDTPEGQAAADRIRTAADPSMFTLALSYDRARTGNDAFAALFVGGQIVDSVPFDFANLAGVSIISRVVAGIGSISGSGYRVQLDLIDLQLWT